MAALTTEIKTFIVQALACFDSPSTVAKAVGANFGVTISRQQVEAHDPTKRCSKGLAKRWVHLFHDTRTAFHRAIADIPIANRSYRLRVLGRMAVQAEVDGNLRMVCQLYEQAAKECGDAYLRRCSAPLTGDRPASVLMDYALWQVGA